VPALTGLGAPYWDPYARGTIVGISRGTTAGHLARATLESMAYQTADVLEAMQRDAGCSLQELRVDGGACSNDVAMQFQAGVLGVDVVRPRVTETTALGAAFMAGLHAGVWNDLDEVEALWQPERRFTPALDDARRTQLLANWHRAVERSRAWAQ
jgi:glycerol kinase